MFIADKILAVKGDTGSPTRRFLISWHGYGPEHNSWQPRKNLQPEMVNEFLNANDMYDHNWPGVRCPHCDQPCKSDHGLNLHLRKCLLKPEDEQKFKGTCAEAKVKENKLKEAQKKEENAKH